MAYARAQDWITQLKASGLVPPMCRRVIIDIPHDDVITVYIERMADTNQFEVVRDIIAGSTKVVEVSGAK